MGMKIFASLKGRFANVSLRTASYSRGWESQIFFFTKSKFICDHIFIELPREISAKWYILVKTSHSKRSFWLNTGTGIVYIKKP